jgi:ribosomal 30S subunit maturation factor RimM
VSIVIAPSKFYAAENTGWRVAWRMTRNASKTALRLTKTASWAQELLSARPHSCCGPSAGTTLATQGLKESMFRWKSKEHDKMKHINRYALTLTSAALMCGTAAAQDRTVQQAPTPNRELKAGEFQASHLIGAPVKSTSGDTVGTVEDLIVASGDVNLAVISVGGVLGVGDKKIALPYNQLTVSPDGDTLFVKLTEEELKAKPMFDPEADDVAEKAAADRSPARTPAPAPASSTVRRDSETPAQAAAPERQASVPQRSAETSAPQRAAPAARTDARTATNEARTLKASEQPASSLIGASVVDSQNSKIGKIHDLLVSAGRQGVQAILAVGGGVAGVGSHMVAVPLDELTIKRDANEDRRREPDSVQTLLTVSQLESMPEFRYE